MSEEWTATFQVTEHPPGTVVQFVAGLDPFIHIEMPGDENDMEFVLTVGGGVRADVQDLLVAFRGIVELLSLEPKAVKITEGELEE